MSREEVKLPLSVGRLAIEADYVVLRVEDVNGRVVSEVQIDPDESKVKIGSLVFRVDVSEWFVENDIATLAAGKCR